MTNPPPPETRCIICGCPSTDHTPIRYAIRAYLLHLLPARIAHTFQPHHTKPRGNTWPQHL